MKKILLIAIAALFTFSNAQAQLPNGSIGPDFTATDLNGNTINLYTDFLDQGIPVIMDVSATWCGPCWSFHQGHALKDIYMTYGMGGSQEIGVIFVEGDGSTGLAQLQGTGGSTAGDWITGTPYPILDNASIANSYDIAYYPTVYGICPDRTVYEIGQGSASNLRQQLISNCGLGTSFTGVIDNAGIEGSSTKICLGQDAIPSASVHNYGTNSIASFTAELFELGNPIAIDVNNWTGTLAASGNVTVQFNPVAATTPTTYEVMVSSPNGNPDNYPTYNEGEFYLDFAANTTDNTAIFKLKIDAWGTEITWNIKDGTGALLASGGPYADGASGTEYTTNIPLSSDGCYELTINDSYGDGINSPGGYSLQDQQQVLFSEVGPNFGYNVIEPFSKSGSVLGITNQSSVNLNIYPNPVKDVLTIEGNYTSVDVFDMFGKLVLSSEYTKNINVSTLANGIYMLNITTEKGIQTQKITITK